jgi:RimJ/RimL family protein N-acetyltransferase
MSTPELHLRTGFVLNGAGRIESTREPGPRPGPLFALVRGATRCAWAVRADVPDDLAHELDRLAREEPPAAELREPPLHAGRYLSLVANRIGSRRSGRAEVEATGGPAFWFPDGLAQPEGVVTVDDERRLTHHFRGWVPGEIAAGRAPVLAVIEEGHPVSVCFSARLSGAAAEAGVETAQAFRGRGFASRVATAWALATRASGRAPLYTTAWSNAASLAVARKLGLVGYASHWELGDSRQGEQR